MSCADLPDWYLRHRMAVVDLRSAAWRRARAEVVPPGYAPDECMRRLARAGRLRRVGRGLYVVVDPVRETPAVAIASALFGEVAHYVTTDAALAVHGLIDQPIRTITVVLSSTRRAIDIGRAVVRPVTVSEDRLRAADAYATTADGFAVRLASRAQAVVDALAEPAWMMHGDLLAEVLAAFADDELEQTTTGALARSTAAGQRLGYLLEEAGRPPPQPLAELRPLRAVRLRPKETRRGPYSTRWRVYG
jgi:predicted transcriptional regulator of viral defense system